MTARVLALDLATVTGWALHKPDMQRPFFGAVKLLGSVGEVGKRADALERWLRGQHRLHRFTHYVFEAQHVAAKMDIDTVYMLIALGGVVEKFAFQVGAHCYKVHISEWRKHFLGRGAGFGKTNPKELAIQRCAQYGWYTDVHDAAEACGILDFFLTMIPAHPRPWRDAVFMKGAI
jgi:hypothetical protein